MERGGREGRRGEKRRKYIKDSEPWSSVCYMSCLPGLCLV